MNLKKEELKTLFNASVDNARHLFDSAMELALKYEKKKFPSLGLAELALEELGKSFTCLAYYSRANQINDWTIFWKEWKNHDLKAHRAFFYEFFSLVRLTLNYPDRIPNLMPRGTFSKEKEHAFYVDIDKGNRKIHIPESEIEDEECVIRVASIIGLLNTSALVKDWLNSDFDENFKCAISDYAYKTISTKINHQDVEAVVNSMRTTNEKYNSGLDAILKLFNPNSTM